MLNNQIHKLPHGHNNKYRLYGTVAKGPWTVGPALFIWNSTVGVYARGQVPYNHLFLFYTVATYFTTAKIIRYKLVCVSKAEFLPPWMKGNLKQNQPSVLSNFLLYAPLSSLHNSELLTPCIKNTVPQKATKFQPCPYVHIRFFSLCFLIFNLVRQDEWSHFLSKKTFEIMEV